MPERQGYLPGVPCWVDTSQPDPEAAVAFYQGLFGWHCEDVMPGGADGTYYIARLRDGDVAAIASLPGAGGAVASWDTYICVQSADEAATKVFDAGGRVVMGPVDVSSAGRMAVCADLEGAVFRVWQAREHFGARIVNEPGAFVFNGLATRDAEAARRFYGAVFGWEALGLTSAGALWRLPGYGEHLEHSDPERRRRLVPAGTPQAFRDAVAALSLIGPGRPGVSPHWSVTFSVEDADATAAKAVELGGRLLVPPFDAPWARMTVIADPQGATFTASKHVPANRTFGSSRADLPDRNYDRRPDPALRAA
jgi:predicted enzyme related to lactoylglutathione lyase